MSAQHMRRVSLDDIDYRIVEVLSESPELSNRELAQRIELPESTCAYRLRRLREAKMIRPSRLVIDHAKLGYPLTAVIIVYLTHHTREVVERFMRSVSQAPGVLQVMNVAGRYDFMVTVAVADAEQLRLFVLDHVTVHQGVRGTETHIVFDKRDGEWVPTKP